MTHEKDWTDVSISPKRSGKYKVKNNSGVNDGYGHIDYIVGTGWDIPKDFIEFYKILKWREDEDTFNF